jgi:hypothetical protein
MNHGAENKDLLDDVLAESVPEDFRAALLGETLLLARRRRYVRRVRRAAGAMAVVFMFAALAWWLARPLSKPATTIASPAILNQSYSLIYTVPLPASALVGTQPMNASTLIVSERFAGIVQTKFGSGYRLINDDELLALAAPRHAALVRIGPGAQELIFLSPTEPRN